MSSIAMDKSISPSNAMLHKIKQDHHNLSFHAIIQATQRTLHLLFGGLVLHNMPTPIYRLPLNLFA